MSAKVRKRLIERHCAASIRALSGHASAEYRRELLYENNKGVEIFSPHLAASPEHDSLTRCRGVADAMACRLSFTDLLLHESLMPEDQIARIVFDTFEQIRVESLAPAGLLGLKRNMDASFHQWCRASRGEGVAENELGLLIYSITQIARLRLINEELEPEVEDIIESTRFKLAPIVGPDLAQLRKVKHDQSKFAELALRIAATIAEFAKMATGDQLDHETAKVRQKMLMPRQHEVDERYVEGGASGAGAVQSIEAGNYPYPIFTTEYDVEISGKALYRLEQRTRMRVQLDRMVAAQAVSVPRLAQRLKNLFSVPEKSGWNFGEEEGYLDGRRLGQLVSNPAYSRVFKRQRWSQKCDTAVSFLIDNSGSMKRQRFEAVTIIVDILSRALELAGIRSEILGFTTAGWTGGKSIEAWRKAGMPAEPGRLNDRMHIIYKDFATTWRRSRYGIASMLNTTHFREGLDGEALQWASQRLFQEDVDRRCLVMISDGAPMDSATHHHNDEQFLERHLSHVVDQIEKSGAVELRGIGIGLDMDEFFRESIALDLTGTLGNQEFRALETLYG